MSIAPLPFILPLGTIVQEITTIPKAMICASCTNTHGAKKPLLLKVTSQKNRVIYFYCSSIVRFLMIEQQKGVLPKSI
jgi:hypothetical protein